MSRSYYRAGEGEKTFVIKHSRFLTFIKTAQTEERALELLDGIKRAYRDATHVCYAYRIGGAAVRARFSDAGEPQGTAGKPMLEALTELELSDTLAVVVRYFGGVKLGAGGLTRAYRSCVADAVKEFGRTKYALCSITELRCGVAKVGALVRAAQGAGARVINRAFSAEASLTVATQGEPEELIKALRNAVSGELDIVKTFEGYVPEDADGK